MIFFALFPGASRRRGFYSSTALPNSAQVFVVPLSRVAGVGGDVIGDAANNKEPSAMLCMCVRS